MNFLMNLGWLGKSVTAMICIIPLMLMFNFFGKNYGVKPESLMCSWFIGVAIGIAVSVWRFEVFNSVDLYTPLIPLLIVVLLGILIGTPANILLAHAVPKAPNPALPFTIVNIGSVLAYMLAPAMAILLPRYFDKIQFSLINLVGILMVAIGMGLVMYRTS